MDIALVSMALSQGQVRQQASLSIMKKTMEQAEGNVDFLRQMLSAADVKGLEMSVSPHLGKNIDIRA